MMKESIFIAALSLMTVIGLSSAVEAGPRFCIYKPSKPTIENVRDDYSYAVDSGLSLTCKRDDKDLNSCTYVYQWLKASIQPGTISWEKLNSSTSVYNVMAVTVNAAGIYSCRVGHWVSRSKTYWSEYSSDITILVKEAETWTNNTCSTMWTRWMSRDQDTTHMEYRYQFCVDISSQERTRNWKLKEENRTLKLEPENPKAPGIPTIWFPDRPLNVGETINMVCLAAPDGGKPTSYQWYHNTTRIKLPDTSTPPFQPEYANAFFKTVRLVDSGTYYCEAMNDEGKETSEEKKLEIGGEFCADQPTASPRVDNSQNKAEVILAVTLTFIMLLVVAVVVLVVFLVRLKRSLHDREPRGEGVAFHAESNGNGPAVKMKDRRIPEAKSNFDPYAALGDKNIYAVDDYGSLGEQKRIARPRGEKDNAAFETEDGDYLDIIGEGRMVSPSLQAELEDGYRRNEADAPVYHVLEHEPSNVTSDNRNEGAAYSLAEVTDPRSQVGGDQGVESVYALEERNGDVYAIPDKNKTGKGGAPVYSLPGRSRPKPTPGKTTSCDKETPDTKHSLAGIPGGKPQPSQSLAGKLNDDSADYSQLYGRAPGAKYPDKNKMAAKGGQGKALPSNGDGDEYSRLQIPTLTKPSTMQFLEKKPKQMKGVNSAQEDVQGDDDEDYEYSTACEVIT